MREDVRTTVFTHEERDSETLREDAGNTCGPRAGELDIYRDASCYVIMGLDSFMSIHSFSNS